MTRAEPTVFVVDDEEQSRESVCALVRSMHHQGRAFDSGEAFIELYDGEPGCLVADYRMAGMNGLELREELAKRQLDLPVIVVTAYARTPMTVQAIQKGAVTMLDKPYEDDDLWQAIRKGLALDQQRRQTNRATRVGRSPDGQGTPSARPDRRRKTQQDDGYRIGRQPPHD